MGNDEPARDASFPELEASLYSGSEKKEPSDLVELVIPNCWQNSSGPYSQVAGEKLWNENWRETFHHYYNMSCTLLTFLNMLKPNGVMKLFDTKFNEESPSVLEK
ncbi:hypothetical protein I7I51_03205 [Histoplasma capsulatum]|uniref:Uncharacterized protein n=2 Tax=Histoplasma TaxID=5036 RepID=A0A8A1MQX3_AJECA|nr:hypothetical protein I7I51_03205 [Histoplasma capsulatum]